MKVLHITGRGRPLRIAATALCAAVVIGLGIRYFVVREQRRDAEQTVATLTRRAVVALRLLHDVQAELGTAETSNAAVQADRDRVRTLATALHAQLSETRGASAAAQVGAYVSGTQANNLSACLTGVSQALNQLAVGDAGSITSLRAVDAPCRAAGIQ